MATPAGGTVRTAGRWAPVLVALVFLVALNLRPSLTSVGPLLPRIGADEGLSEGVQGLLGALPLLAFGLISPLVHHASRRLGMERTILAALVLIATGGVIRSYTGDAGLWAGTAVIGGAIAVGNVLVPTMVKRDYGAHISQATGVYSACITGAASVASAVAVPLSGVAGWRGALAFWAIPALVVTLVWLPRTRTAGPEPRPAATGDASAVSVWKMPMAWLVTAFMGLQSTTFYIMITWLPTIETSGGVSAKQAGWHLFGYQLVGIASGLAIPRLMRRPDDQRAATVTASVPILAGVLGLLIAPAWSVVWALVTGFGTGASLVVALSLISLRGRTHHETTRLSGMAQSLGYLLAASGPIGVGYLAQHTGSWHASLILIAVVAGIQLVVAIPAGKNRAVAPRSGTGRG